MATIRNALIASGVILPTRLNAGTIGKTDVPDTIRLLGPTQRAYAHKLIDAAPDGYVVKLGAETRRDAQNRKLWPMIAEVRKQVPGGEQWTKDQWKLRFMHGLGMEIETYLPELEHGGFFAVGLSSRELTVAQFAALITMIEAYGAQHGVVCSSLTLSFML